MSGTKGVAMSAGSKKDEIYVGFLLILLSFLYLSHLADELQARALKETAPPSASSEGQSPASTSPKEFS